MVFPNGRTVLGFNALLGNTWADDLRESVDIGGVEAEPRLDLFSKAVGPRFGAEDADLEGAGLWVHSDAFHLVDEVQAVGRGDQDDSRFEIRD